jgi:diketogulonate reductase-like aldo/keto reductase
MVRVTLHLKEGTKWKFDNTITLLRKYGETPLEELDVIVNTLRDIGKAYDKTPAQVALNWCIAKGVVPICGVKNEKQAKDNIGAIGWRMTEQEVTAIDKLCRLGPKTYWQEAM